MKNTDYIGSVEITDEEFEKMTRFCNEVHNAEYGYKKAEVLGFGGKEIFVSPGALVAIDPAKVGKKVVFSFYCYVNGDVTIGDRVLIGPHCSITAGDHKFDPETKAFTKRNNGDYDVSITIGEGSWLAHAVSVTSGVKIGKGNLVCAGAVVTKSTPDFAIMAGIPAKQVGEINPETGEYVWYSKQNKN